MKKRGFTLIELLVSILIISILLLILLPTISWARKQGEKSVCLSNLRQIGMGWTSYMDENRELFPWTEEYEGKEDHACRFGWGGAWLYGFDSNGNPLYPEDESAKNLLYVSRPINPHLLYDEVMIAQSEVYHCPSDNGMSVPAADLYNIPDNPWQDFGYKSDFVDDWTVYGQLGTSYEANEYMYALEGLIVKNRPGYGRHDVHVSHSQFVLVGDAGCMTVAKGGYLPPNPEMDPRVQGWWHDNYKGNLVFLDGHASFQKVIYNSNLKFQRNY